MHWFALWISFWDNELTLLALIFHIGYLRGLWELQYLMLFVAEFSLPSIFWKRMLKLFLDTLTWVICQINRQCFLYSKQIVRIHYLFSCVDFCLTPFHSFLQRPPRQTHLVSWPKKAKKSSARRWAWDSPGLFDQIVIAVALVCPTNLSISPAYLFRCHSLLCNALIRTASQTASWAVSVTQKTSNILLER